MGLGNLTQRASGDTITASFFNDIHSALEGDFVGRDTSGAATSGQNLGTAAIPWGTARVTSLVVAGAVIDSSLSAAPQNRVISGKTRTTSSQPAYLLPTASLAFQVLGSATNLSYDVNGVTCTVSTDITKTGITAAPSSANTCLINDADAAAQYETHYWGEYECRKELTVDTMGSNFQSNVGKWIAFKITHSAVDEYAFGFCESSVKISRVSRGMFYNSSGSPVNRVALSDNDVLTILTLAWVFMDDDGTTVDVTYNNPTWSFSSPSAPVTGDYWYDLANSTWKRYDGASFQIIGRTLIGMACANATAVLGVRCEPFYNRVDGTNTMELEISTTEIIRARWPFAKVAVMGTVIDFGKSIPTWNITTQLAAAADMYQSTEQASTLYYLYIGKTGQCFISDIEPYWLEDQEGWYHPHNTWRAVGIAYNDGSSNLVYVEAYGKPESEVRFENGNGFGATNTSIRKYTNAPVKQTGVGLMPEQTANLGALLRVIIPGHYSFGSHDTRSAAAARIALSRNSTQLTTAGDSITAADRLACADMPTSARGSEVGWSGYCKRGDLVRPHQSGVADDTSTGSYFYGAASGPRRGR